LDSLKAIYKVLGVFVNVIYLAFNG